MKKNDQQAKLLFLQLSIKGHPLFEDGLTFSVLNDQRVYQDKSDTLTNLNGNIWINNIVTLVGKNATGKTLLMKALIGDLMLLLQHKSIDQTPLSDLLIGDKPLELTSYFYGTDGYVYRDIVRFAKETSSQKWVITDEKIYQKKVNARVSKRDFLNFKEEHLITDRSNLDKMVAVLLAPDDSIFRTILATHEYQTQEIIDTLLFTNINALLYTNKTIPTEILEFLDPTIEYLKVELRQSEINGKQFFYHLKFKGQTEEIVETSFTIIEHYLSSGTAKGVTLYGELLHALKNGGIVFIDEFENHFNHAIIRAFIEYFADPKINSKRASLVFSTHYSEILDDLERGDEIYIVKRDQQIRLQRYSKAAVRNELNRSDVFDSDYLNGTAPDYEAYLKLRKATERAVKGIAK